MTTCASAAGVLHCRHGKNAAFRSDRGSSKRVLIKHKFGARRIYSVYLQPSGCSTSPSCQYQWVSIGQSEQTQGRSGHSFSIDIELGAAFKASYDKRPIGAFFIALLDLKLIGCFLRCELELGKWAR